MLRSDIRLATSGIRYASFMANKISRKPKAFISLSRKRQYHSDEVGISLLLFLPICVIMRLAKSLPPGGSLWMRSCNFRGMGFARSICNTNAKLAIKHNDK